MPFVLAPNQVYQFIESLSEQRDKVIIQLLYSTGIRVGECVNLKRQDVNSNRMIIRIVKRKRKERPLCTFKSKGVERTRVIL